MANISSYLSIIKSAQRGEGVRDAIVKALTEINSDNPTSIIPLNVTGNGTYTGKQGTAYNPVTVNVPEGTSSALALDSIKITENGEYRPDDGHAYNAIVVDVPKSGELVEKTITVNGTYNPADDGYDGYSRIYINVPTSGGGGGGGSGSGGTYTVSFYNGSTLLGVVSGVPYGGGATYSGASPTSSGMRFIGWSPSPTNVTSDMNCYARFTSAISEDGEISDDWVTIAENVQSNPAHYTLGMQKFMEFTTYDNTQGEIIQMGAVRMQLVGINVDELEGGNGYAPTTWIAKDEMMKTLPMNLKNTTDGGWEHCWLNNFLSVDYAHPATNSVSQFFGMGFPKELQKYVKPVLKYSRTYNASTGIYITDQPSVQRLWIPSHKEVFGDTSYETKGPYYDIAFPNQNGRIRKTYGGSAQSWWLRSVNNTTDFRYVNYNGSESSYGASLSIGVCLGFCL